jgi:rubredoxin
MGSDEYEGGEMICQAKHTKFQPSDEQWICPKCGADSAFFVVEDGAEDSDDDCPLLHNEDEIECGKCGYGGTGKSVAAQMTRKLDLVPCPCCKGAGYVKKEEK